MLNKWLNVRKLAPFLCHVPSKPTQAAHDRQEEDPSPSVLKLVHVGGRVEFYYMAIPAARIMEKYPSFILARPEIFKRPWDAVVRPEEILTPGEKILVVPVRTVRKLRKRNKKPNGDISISSFVSESSTDDVSAEMVSRHDKNEIPSKVFPSRSHVNGDSAKRSSSIFKSGSKSSAAKHNKHVRFSGIDDVANKQEEKKGNNVTRKSLKEYNSDGSKSNGRKKKVQSAVTWEPKLAVITETYYE